MRSDVIRIYRSVHTWAGILTGMFLFIAFYAGALTVFKEPLARWASPPAAGVAEVPLDAVPELISRALAAYPEAARDFRVHLEPAEHLPARQTWQVLAEGADDHDRLSMRHFGATLEADGTLIGGATQPSQLAEFIDVLHRVVGLPVDNDLHRGFMGIVAAVYALALVSGLIVLLPSLVKDFLALRMGRNLKRMWLDAHNVVGLASLPFHIVMALTAVVFAFHDGIYFLQDKLIHGGKLASTWSAMAGKPRASDAPRDPAAMLPPAELVARARALSPSFTPRTLQYLQVAGPRAMVRVWGHDPAALSARALGGFVALDPYSGRVINADFMPGKQGAALTTISSFFALHFATYGGTPARWMYFLLGLAGAWLFYGGNLLWIESRRRKAAREGGAPPAQRRDVRLMAAATVGVCLGSVCGISLTIVVGKWLHGQVTDLVDWHRYAYYAAFLGAIAWAFAAGAARASVHLLRLAAALTFAIPLTTLLGVLVPALGPWAHTSAASLGVDLTALAGALGFAWMARTASRRATQGPVDSVWSASGHKTVTGRLEKTLPAP